jgi:hypothetical protein
MRDTNLDLLDEFLFVQQQNLHVEGLVGGEAAHPQPSHRRSADRPFHS